MLRTLEGESPFEFSGPSRAFAFHWVNEIAADVDVGNQNRKGLLLAFF